MSHRLLQPSELSNGVIADRLRIIRDYFAELRDRRPDDMVDIPDDRLTAETLLHTAMARINGISHYQADIANYTRRLETLNAEIRGLKAQLEEARNER